MKIRSLSILLLLTLGSAQAVTQTISVGGVVYADLESFARDIGAGIATGSSAPLVWRLAAKGKDMVLVQDSNLAQLNGQRYQMAAKTLLEGGKGYAPLDSLRALFQVNVATTGTGLGKIGTASSGSTTTPTPTDSSASTEGVPVQQPNYSRDELLAAVNKVRAQGRKCGETFYPAAPPLRWNKLLEQAAFKHSKHMAEAQFYAHTDPQGKTASERVLGEGYVGSAIGENIHALYTDDPDKVLTDWVKSSGHCANLMYAGYTDFGLGVYFLPYNNKKQGSGQYQTAREVERRRISRARRKPLSSQKPLAVSEIPLPKTVFASMDPRFRRLTYALEQHGQNSRVCEILHTF